MVRLHHIDLGGAGLPPMLVLHGMLGSARNWQTTGRDLAARYHVFALDARNHGRSPHEAEMTYEAMVADLIAWMDGRGMANAVLVGHSLGGKTAMLLACRHPGRVERLVVVDIAPKAYDSVAHRAEFAAMNELELASLKSRAEAELRFEARVPNLGMRKFLTTNLERDETGAWRWAVNLPVLTAALPQLEQSSLQPADRFAGPTQFIVGGQSQYIQRADHAAIRQHFPLAQITTIADSGHNPHMDRREEFVRLVLGGSESARPELAGRGERTWVRSGQRPRVEPGLQTGWIEFTAQTRPEAAFHPFWSLESRGLNLPAPAAACRRSPARGCAAQISSSRGLSSGDT